MTKILIIEDNEINMKLFTDLLNAKGYEVDKSYDGLEGFNKIKDGEYDLLILDIQLPTLNGFQILEKLENEKIKQPKTLIVSAFAMENEINIAKQYKIEGYMTKPIDIMNFISTVAKIINEAN